MFDARPSLARPRSPSLPVRLAGGITLVAAATIVAAWGFQWAGYPPCELCLKERIPYEAGVPLGAVVTWLAFRGRASLLPAGFAALGLIFALGAGLAVYHAGVEWHLWPGPSSCTGGGGAAPARVEDFLQQLQSVNVVQCDLAALHILGLSLAGWDAVICLALTASAVWGAAWTVRSQGPSGGMASATGR